MLQRELKRLASRARPSSRGYADGTHVRDQFGARAEAGAILYAREPGMGEMRAQGVIDSPSEKCLGKSRSRTSGLQSPQDTM